MSTQTIVDYSQTEYLKRKDIQLLTLPCYEEAQAFEEKFEIIPLTKNLEKDDYKPKYRWIDIGDGEFSLPGHLNLEILIKPVENGFMAGMSNGVNITLVQEEPFQNLESAIEFCEKVIEEVNAIDGIHPIKHAWQQLKIDADWALKARNLPATPKQISFLRQFHAYTPNINKEDALITITTILAIERKKRRLSLGY